MLRFETSLGDFSVELFEKEAPRTVANFLKYVE
ncbi:MAG: peptidylprolyl isomerase, partial [Gammaproteobacteria bacterium]|nr:peptidylprolyl isomerase [Gammaproteobacteria bacterium]MCC6173581.1 peptidylprolyl isomerase [Gammaproteobacteria bacterium]